MPWLADIVDVRLIVGMEVHIQLSTPTKVFSPVRNPAGPTPSGASVAPAPNSLIDPVVLGLPGSLPVLSRAAVEASIRVGLALGCRIAACPRWARKNYFYPDLPKGYQISQHEAPLCEDGVLEISGGAPAGGEPVRARAIRIQRAHLEEDAGKLLHEAPGGGAIEGSIVDFNRAGTPLLEVVTHPDIRSSDEAVAFCRALRDIARHVGASRGVLQMGHMRFEPNINCELTLRDGRVVRTPIVEVKNLNSFAAVKGAIDAERRDQPARWVATGQEHAPGAKQTRGFDPRAIGEGSGLPGSPESPGATVLQREKEDALDYRYFPDPDLPPLAIDPAWVRRLAATLPPLPAERERRCLEDGLSTKEASALIAEPEDCTFFERVRDLLLAGGLSRSRAAKGAANLVLQSGLKRTNELGPTHTPSVPGDEPEAIDVPSALLVSSLGITPEQAASIALMREGGQLSASNADVLFGLICDAGDGSLDPEALARTQSLLTIRDDAALDAWVDQALRENAGVAEQVRAGKIQALGRLVGAAMKLSAGAGDAKAIRERLLARLGVSEP